MRQPVLIVLFIAALAVVAQAATDKAASGNTIQPEVAPSSGSKTDDSAAQTLEESLAALKAVIPGLKLSNKNIYDMDKDSYYKVAGGAEALDKITVFEAGGADVMDILAKQKGQKA